MFYKRRSHQNKTTTWLQRLYFQCIFICLVKPFKLGPANYRAYRSYKHGLAIWSLKLKRFKFSWMILFSFAKRIKKAQYIQEKCTGILTNLSLKLIHTQSCTTILYLLYIIHLIQLAAIVDSKARPWGVDVQSVRSKPTALYQDAGHLAIKYIILLISSENMDC